MGLILMSHKMIKMSQLEEVHADNFTSIMQHPRSVTAAI